MFIADNYQKLYQKLANLALSNFDFFVFSCLVKRRISLQDAYKLCYKRCNYPHSKSVHFKGKNAVPLYRILTTGRPLYYTFIFFSDDLWGMRVFNDVC